MVRGDAKRIRPQRPKSDAEDMPETGNFTGASEQIPLEILDALAFGYLQALKDREHLPIPTVPPASNNLEFGYEDADVEAFEDFGRSDEDVLRREVPLAEKEAAPRDIIGDLFQCIFAAFNQRGIPITTQTRPNAVMGLPVWIGVGRSILACVVDKYPEFGSAARPSSLRAFYGQTLLSFAQAMRASILKHG